MRNKIVKSVTLSATSLALILSFGGVNASVIDNARETMAGNGTAADAQDVESDFTTGSGAGDPNIFESGNSDWEWVSITTNDRGYTDPANGIDGSSFDYFTFSVFAGQQFIFDIDTGVENPDSDSILRLYDGANSDSTQLAFNDDMNGPPTNEDTRDSGSLDLFDSLLYYTFASGGFATLRVSDACSALDALGKCVEGVLAKSAAYDLQISRSLSPIPVPAAVWLFGTALLGFVGMSRRTSIKS